MTAKTSVPLLLVCLMSLSAAGQTFGTHYMNRNGKLQFSDEQVQFTTQNSAYQLTIANSAITGLAYRRTSRGEACYAAPETRTDRVVSNLMGATLSSPLGLVLFPPLIALTALSGAEHCLTVDYTDAPGAARSVVLRLDKRNYRQVIAAAERSTGHAVMMPTKR